MALIVIGFDGEVLVDCPDQVETASPDLIDEAVLLPTPRLQQVEIDAEHR